MVPGLSCTDDSTQWQVRTMLQVEVCIPAHRALAPQQGYFGSPDAFCICNICICCDLLRFLCLHTTHMMYVVTQPRRDARFYMRDVNCTPWRQQLWTPTPSWYLAIRVVQLSVECHPEDGELATTRFAAWRCVVGCCLISPEVQGTGSLCAKAGRACDSPSLSVVSENVQPTAVVRHGGRWSARYRVETAGSAMLITFCMGQTHIM